jgi:hypothetical protein
MKKGITTPSVIKGQLNGEIKQLRNRIEYPSGRIKMINLTLFLLYN